MYRNHIHNRTELAMKLGVSPTTVYSAFESDWSGHASTAMLAHVAWLLDVPMSALVEEPAAERNKVRTNGHPK
jgi:DNA-binding XRE family transcriptional regulator